MPTYEYVCRSCGDGFEVTQAFADLPRTTCEQCGGPLKKVYGSIGIVFKGSGFYRTENRATSSSSASVPTGNGSSADKAVASAPESTPPSQKDGAAKAPGGSGSAGAKSTTTPKKATKP